MLPGGAVRRPDGEVVMLGGGCHFVVDRDKLDPSTWEGQLVHPSATQRAMERGIPVKTYSFRAPFSGPRGDRRESSA